VNADREPTTEPWQKSGGAGQRAWCTTEPVTFVQRLGGLVNLNVHFHLVVPDGRLVLGSATPRLLARA